MKSYAPKSELVKGQAEIKVLPKVIKVTMDEPDEKGKPRVYEFDRLDAPMDIKGGHFNVALNPDPEKPRLFSPNPIPKKGPDGKYIPFIAVYDGIDHPEDGLPSPKNAEAKTYDKLNFQTGNLEPTYEPESRVFTMRFKVLAGDYKGCRLPFYMRYLFAEYETSGEAMIYIATPDKPWSDWFRTLNQTLKVAGIEQTDTIPYDPDGVATLVSIDKLLRDRKRVVKAFAGKGGWVNRIQPGDEGLTVETFDEKPAKPVKHKKVEVLVDDPGDTEE